MENNIDVYCLDFYGLPGSGKSTISHLLADKLRGEVDVIEPSFHIDHDYSVIERIIKKSTNTLRLMLRRPGTFRSVVELINNCGYNCFKKDFYIHLLNISYKIVFLNNLPKGYVIFDQGLWQSVVSLFYRKEDIPSMIVVYDKLYSLVNKSVQFINIYVQVDVNTAIERMDTRHAAISRVQLLNDAEKLEELKKQQTIMEVLPAPKIVVNSAQNDVNWCVQYIADKLTTPTYQ